MVPVRGDQESLTPSAHTREAGDCLRSPSWALTLDSFARIGIL
jgi:hypothetical protein